MAKRGGFPGGMPGNMNNLMKQAQRMQRQMEETTKELEEKEYSASAGYLVSSGDKYSAGLERQECIAEFRSCLLQF